MLFSWSWLGLYPFSTLHATVQDINLARFSVLEYLARDDRALVIASFWDGDVLVVGVRRTAESRDDFAAYLCGVMREYEAGPGQVRVVDYQAIILRLDDTILAERDCPNL